jgi:type I restriction enzyme M protein
MVHTPPLTLSQLERHLYAATDIMRSKVDTSAYQEYFFGLLFLKRCSDLFEQRWEQLAGSGLDAPQRARFGDTLYVPPEARWSFLCSCAANEGNAARLDQALAALERENASLRGALGHLSFSSRPGRAGFTEQTLRDLLRHFSRYRLRDEDLEFPDILGAAYEYLLADFAGTAGKRAGEFYTPRDVLDVMVRILAPGAGMSIYDPCAGSGGALILALQYVSDGGGSPQELPLYGQESNARACALCKMNALLHGSPGADIRNEDTLARPQHVEGGALMRFDRVISNPPYSQNYTRAELTFPERFRYGFCPETGKRGDLMFVQHMLSVLAPGGMLATVVPHGVLFRGGAEQAIRRGLVEDDVLEAVVGLPANLFYATSIPTCILIMRPPDGKPPERRGRVLFINADADYEAVRGQNRLSPEHRERLVGTFGAWDSVPGYAAVVDNTVLAANDFNLNIRRYVDASPPPEPHDVRAHLLGGVPKGEVEGLLPQLRTLGLDARVFFVERAPDDGYLDFRAGLTERAQIKGLIVEHAGVRSKEALLLCACQQWWKRNGEQLLALLLSQHMLGARETLLRSFEATLSPVGLLDGDGLRGTFATWWEGVRYDLKTLAAKGFGGLLDSWAESCVAAAQGRAGAGLHGGQAGALDHKLLGHLLPSYLEELAEVNLAIADLEGQLAEAKPDEENEDEEEPEVVAQQSRGLRTALAGQRRARTALLGELGSRLEAARAGRTFAACRQTALDLWLSDLLALIERRVAGQRGQLTASIEHLWHKYRVSLREIEADRRRAELRVDAILKELGYADG